MKTNIIHLVIPVLLSGAALGQSVETLSFEFGNPVNMEVTEIDQTGYLSLFDSSLGTLTGAELTIWHEVESSIFFTNEAAQKQTFHFTANSYLYLTSDNADIATKIGSGSQIKPTWEMNNVVIEPNSVLNLDTHQFSDQASFDLSDILPSLLQTPDSDEFSVNGESLWGMSLIGGGGNLKYVQSTSAGIGARIVYTYEPIPEPTTFGLAGLSLLGLLRRRR